MIALFIATVKAIIVGLIFMHLLHDKPVNAVIAVAGFVFLGIFLMFDFIDVTSRTDPKPINLHAPPPQSRPCHGLTFSRPKKRVGNHPPSFHRRRLRASPRLV